MLRVYHLWGGNPISFMVQGLPTVYDHDGSFSLLSLVLDEEGHAALLARLLLEGIQVQVDSPGTETPPVLGEPLTPSCQTCPWWEPEDPRQCGRLVLPPEVRDDLEENSRFREAWVQCSRNT